jgi:hypothetical protein
MELMSVGTGFAGNYYVFLTYWCCSGGVALLIEFHVCKWVGCINLL